MIDGRALRPGRMCRGGATMAVVMGVLSFFGIGCRQGQTPTRPPWEGRLSIYDHITSHLDSTGARLTDAGNALPDEEVRSDDGGLKWVSGGQDGAFGRHAGGGGDTKTARKVSELVVRIARRGAREDQIELYRALMPDGLLDYLDPAMERIAKAGIRQQPHLHEFARFLATKAPDRGPVKFGIALLGLIKDAADRDVVMLLGRHEEFTLYSAVALGNMLHDPDESMWELARSVTGWGRIELVDRLAQTRRPEIRRWLLREGYRNDIMLEYSAYVCATGGNLRAAITAATVDDELLTAAGDMISAMAAGGPAKGLDDYSDAAVVVRFYLERIAPEASDLRRFIVVTTIEEYLSDKDWNARARKVNGWDDASRQAALERSREILRRPSWHDRVRQGLESEDEQLFSAADAVATHLGIDTWDAHWRRLREKPLDSGRWFHVMRTADGERIHSVVAFALAALPLDEVAAGPSNTMGVGKEYEAHQCLDFIVQDLGRYPGQGWPLIAAALKSPVVRNRYMALKALSRWGRDRWPAEAPFALRAAETIEPDTDVKATIRRIIAGQPFDAPGEAGDE
ncbi:MAG: hypothetical protein AB2L07_01300 [Thermoanaerobaculaceae bacterium]